MRHPEFLLIPVLMFSDYLLTIAGARLRLDGYSAHFKTRHYELNPVWQRAVTQLRWFNPRHVLLTIALSGILIACAEIMRANDPLVPCLAGFLIGILGTVNGRHLGNLATFLYARRHRDALSGTITLSHDFVLFISTFQMAALLVPALLLALYRPEPAVLGFLAGVVALIAIHLIWIARHRGNAPAAPGRDQPDSGESPSS